MRTRKRTLVFCLCLGFCLGLATSSFAASFGGFGRSSNNDVKKLDDKRGRCPCFDEKDLAKLIEDSGPNAMCTYNFSTDRRLRIFDQAFPSPNSDTANAFIRAGVACFGPKVRRSFVSGLPPVGGFALYDREGQDCAKKILRVADKYKLKCACLDQNGNEVDCPKSLSSSNN